MKIHTPVEPDLGWIQKGDGSGLEGLYALGSQRIDTVPIIEAELKKLSYPWPVEVARAGLRGIDDRARKILADKGLTAFSESDYRAAVRQAIADLTGGKDSLEGGSPLTAGELVEGDVGLLEDDVTAALRARSVAITAESYRAELDDQAEAQRDDGEEIVYTGDRGSQEVLHAVAMVVLKERGKDLEYTTEDYRSALNEAQRRVEIRINPKEGS